MSISPYPEQSGSSSDSDHCLFSHSALIIKHRISSSSESTFVSPELFSLDRTSAALFSAPFSYYIVNLNCGRQKRHLTRRPDRSVTFMSHLSPAWSLCTVIDSMIQYVMSMISSRNSTRNSLSKVEYFFLSFVQWLALVPSGRLSSFSFVLKISSPIWYSKASVSTL